MRSTIGSCPRSNTRRSLIDAGELGEIRQVRGSYLQDWGADPEDSWTWRMDEDLAGAGALGDLGAHTVDLARFLVSDQAGDIERVSGHLETFVEERPTGDGETKPVTVDDAYTAEAAFENGAMGTFEASRVAMGHKNDHSIAVHGSAGSLEFSLERLNELEVLRGDGRGYETVLVTDESDPYVEHWWPPGHVLGWEHTLRPRGLRVPLGGARRYGLRAVVRVRLPRPARARRHRTERCGWRMGRHRRLTRTRIVRL